MMDEVFFASPISTICTCPGFLPGKARRELVELGHRAQMPIERFLERRRKRKQRRKADLCRCPQSQRYSISVASS